jgi:hypothetical protein
MHENTVRTSKKTHRVSITTVNWEMLFGEIIAVYSENHTKPMNSVGKKKQLVGVKACGTYIYHGALKCILHLCAFMLMKLHSCHCILHMRLRKTMTGTCIQ